METPKSDKVKLFKDGRDEFERTDQFLKKVEEIRREVAEKHSQKLSNERNWIRRFIIKIKVELEVRKKVRVLSSLKNLHATV